MNDDPDSSSTGCPQFTIALTVLTPVWHEALPDAEGLARRAARGALAAVPVSAADAGETELSLVLADDATVHRLNRDYRGQDRPTNVLSFAAESDADPRDAGPRLLGDVVLSYDTLAREAGEQGKSLAGHLSHLVVHGVLHLLGYDHASEAEAARMERIETAVLADLGISDPYAPAAPGTARCAELG